MSRSKKTLHLFNFHFRYTIDYLVNNKEFELVSVPDLLHPDIIRACGMDVDGERTQVFKLDIEKFGKVALSGTAEMAFGGLFMNKNIDFGQSKKVDKYKRVKRYCAVSRCYRAESSRGQQERGIYRVHNFTKGNTIRIWLFLGSVFGLTF